LTKLYVIVLLNFGFGDALLTREVCSGDVDNGF